MFELIKISNLNFKMENKMFKQNLNKCKYFKQNRVNKTKNRIK